MQLFAMSVSGFLEPLLWICQAHYTGECCTKETKGLYFGIIWGFLGFSSVISSLIIMFILPNVDSSVFFAIITVIYIITIILMAFLPLDILEKKE